jgi:hypothetical protein
MALVVAGACSGSDIVRPTSPATRSSASAERQAVGSALSASSPRSGAFHVTKNCSENTGLAGAFCTITASNVEQLQIGSKVVYLTADGPTFGDSDIIIYPPHPGNNTAFGHCYVDFITLVGRCTISGGTGKFKWLVADARVSYAGGLDGFDWAWDGTYNFSPKD